MFSGFALHILVEKSWKINDFYPEIAIRSLLLDFTMLFVTTLCSVTSERSHKAWHHRSKAPVDVSLGYKNPRKLVHYFSNHKVSPFLLLDLLSMFTTFLHQILHARTDWLVYISFSFLSSFFFSFCELYVSKHSRDYVEMISSLKQRLPYFMSLYVVVG